MTFLVLGVLATPPPAGAVDYKITGEWLFGVGALNTAFALKKDGRRTQAATEDKFAATQRLRTWFNAAVSEDLSGTVNLEFGDTVWGSEKTHAGGGALGADAANIKLRQAFMDWTAPAAPLKFRMGIQGMTLPYTAGGSSILDSDGCAGIVASYAFNERVGLTGMWARPYNDFNNPQGGADLWDNYDLLMLSVPLSMNGWKATPWAAAGMVGGNTVRYGEYPDTLRGGTDVYTNLVPYTLVRGALNGVVSDAALNSRPYSGLFFAGLPMAVNPDPWILELDMNYGAFQGLGGYDITDYRHGMTRRGDSRRAGWLVKGRVEYAMNRGTPGILGWYASGDDGDIRNGSERLPALGPCAYFTSFIGDDVVAGVLKSGGNDSYDLQLNYAGLWGLGIQVRDVALLTANLRHTLRVVYIGGTNSPSMINYLNSTDFGESKVRYLTTLDHMVEVNFDSIWKLYENLDLVMEFAYIANGIDKEAWNRSCRNDDSIRKDDGYKAAVIAKLTF